MARRKKYLRPSQALAAALASIATGTVTAEIPSAADPVRIERLQAAIESDRPFGESQFILERPEVAVGSESYAYHYSHRSHASHRSHSSHRSHQSHYSSSY